MLSETEWNELKRQWLELQARLESFRKLEQSLTWDEFDVPWMEAWSSFFRSLPE
jgi:hypothetical protein